MAINVVEWVMDNAPEHGAGPRGALIVLAWHAQPDGGGAWPSQATIAKKSGQKDRAVRDALLKLQAEGSIVLEGRRPGGGTAIYRVVMDAEERRAKAWAWATRKAAA